MFLATDMQVAQIVANAVNASVPVGMGFLHYKKGDKSPEEFLPLATKSRIAVDYFQGRMVKLFLTRLASEQTWVTDSLPPHLDYQSWSRVYPDWRDLVVSGGGVPVED